MRKHSRVELVRNDYYEPQGRVGSHLGLNYYKNKLARNAETCLKATSDSVDLSLLKLLCLGIEWGHIEGSKIYQG